MRTPAAVETTILAALATDLDGAFEQVVVAYQGRLYGFALRLSGNAQDAEEIAQDAFVRAYRALQRFDAARIGTLALRPWLYQIALNVARNRLRGKRHQTVPLLVGDDEAVRGSPEPADDLSEGPSMFAERAELSTALACFVDQLPDRYRPAVILRHVAGLPYPEVAVALQQPLGTVKANVHRGIGLLRAEWLAHTAKEETDDRTHLAVAR